MGEASGERWITAGAVARRFGTTRTTVWRWVMAGLFARWRTVGPGRYVEIASEAVDDFEANYRKRYNRNASGGDDAA